MHNCYNINDHIIIASWCSESPIADLTAPTLNDLSACLPAINFCAASLNIDVHDSICGGYEASCKGPLSSMLYLYLALSFEQLSWSEIEVVFDNDREMGKAPRVSHNWLSKAFYFCYR